MNRSLCVIACLALVFIVGCGGQPTTTVTGKVTFAGKPVTAGLINFQRADAPPLGGPLNADGSYEFRLPPGDYQVRIDAPGVMPPRKEGDPEPKPVPRLAPAKYADFAGSGLTVTVTGEAAQQRDFVLE